IVLCSPRPAPKPRREQVDHWGIGSPKEDGLARHSIVAARCKLGSVVAMLVPQRARYTCKFSMTRWTEFGVSANGKRPTQSTASIFGLRGSPRCATHCCTRPRPAL